MSDNPDLDLQAHLKQRLGQIDAALSGCAAEYDEGRKELGAHHGKMEARAGVLRRRMALLRPQIERFLHTEEPQALDDVIAAKGQEYLKLGAELAQVTQAKRLAFGGSVPPGQQALGEPIG
jgi:hypothetical protein